MFRVINFFMAATVLIFLGITTSKRRDVKTTWRRNDETSKRRDDGGIEIKITLKKADPKFFRIFCKHADNSNDEGDDDDIAKLGDKTVL